jgi:hypothetical protein
MSYGMEFKNDYGERIFNSNGMLFELHSGTMQWMQQNYFSTGDGDSFTGFEQSTVYEVYRGERPFLNGYTRSYFSGHVHRNWTDGYTWSDTAYGRYAGSTAQVSSNSLVYKTVGLGQRQLVRQALPNTTGQELLNFQDVFFELPSEGLHFFATMRNPYNYLLDSSCKGLKSIAMPHSDRQTGIGYVVATSVKPSIVGVNHGLQVNDSDGEAIYDSRYDTKAIRIKDHVYISSSDLYDVLYNGQTKTYNLRQSISNPYVGGSNFLNWRWRVQSTGSTGRQVYRMWYPKLTISGSTLTMSVTEYDEGGFLNSDNLSPTEFSRYEGSTLMIADMG